MQSLASEDSSRASLLVQAHEDQKELRIQHLQAENEALRQEVVFMSVRIGIHLFCS